MSKNFAEDLVSESEYGDIPLDEAIKTSVKDIQNALNNIEQHLLSLIDHDVITHEEYRPCWELSNDMVDLAKELKCIVKSFKPKGFKLGIVSPEFEKPTP